MPAVERIDSPNPAVRAIERWKRGAGVAVIVMLALLPGAVAAVLALVAVDLLGATSWSYAAALITFVVIAPWGLGQRFVIRQIGRLAEVADS